MYKWKGNKQTSFLFAFWFQAERETERMYLCVKIWYGKRNIIKWKYEA